MSRIIITPHAKMRRKQMGVTEDQIKAALTEPEIVYPGGPESDRLVYQKGSIAVVIRTEDSGIHVITVLWRAEGVDTMSRKWQGIGPAVDAHLALLGLANRGVHLARQINANAGSTPELLDQIVRNEWMWRWSAFASSYGHPDKNGIPQIEVGIQEGQTISGREQFTASQGAINQGAHLGLREHKMLSLATSHYVSANVIDEVTLAASQAGPEPLFDTDLFTPHGFAVLEHPIVMPDLDPRTGKTHPTIKTHIRAIGWTREEAIFSKLDDKFHAGVSLFLYTTADDYAEGYYRTSVEAGLADTIPPEMVASGSQLVQIEVIPWCFGVDWSPRDDAEYVPGTVPTPVAYERRWFMAFMRLCWQEIIVRHVHRPDRPTHRRWERLAKGKLLDYSVLHLRREVDPNYKPQYTGQGLDYRQHVRGTWKRVYYATMGPARLSDGRMNPDSHRLKWIEAYWRGPEDGEEGPTHKATSVTR